MARADAASQAMKLLELLTAAPEQRLSHERAVRELCCTDTELQGYLELIAALADRVNGTRAVVIDDGRDLYLEGDAAALHPLRVNMGESLALSYALEEFNIELEQRNRIADALLPTGFSADARALLATAPSFGPHRAQLTEAIQDGVRCRIWYRAHDEHEPCERLVDPISIITDRGFAYLIAWNIEKDEERRYRLDRIADVSFTDESVVIHPAPHRSIRESLRQTGELVVLEMPDEMAAQLSWAGIESCTPISGKPGHTRVSVHISSHAWLFDQVLSAGGAVVISSPQTLIDELRTYTAQLLSDD